MQSRRSSQAWLGGTERKKKRGRGDGVGYAIGECVNHQRWVSLSCPSLFSLSLSLCRRGLVDRLGRRVTFAAHVRERDAHGGLTWHNRHHPTCCRCCYCLVDFYFRLSLSLLLFIFFFLSAVAVVFTWTGHVDRAGHHDRHHLPNPYAPRPISTVNLTTRTKDLSQRITELFKSLELMANEISRLVLFLFLFFISATQTSDDRLLWPSLQTISSLVPLLVLTALLTCSVPDGTRISRHFERATKKNKNDKSLDLPTINFVGSSVIYETG